MARGLRAFRQLTQPAVENSRRIGPRRNGISQKRILLHVVRQVLPLQLGQNVRAASLNIVQPAYLVADIRARRNLSRTQSAGVSV